MTNCIRCGANVALDGKMFVTADGGISCPASLPGEAAVHRIASRLPSSASQQPKATLTDVLFGLGKLFAVYKGAEFVTREAMGGNRHNNDFVPYVPDSDLDKYSSLARGLILMDPNRR